MCQSCKGHAKHGGDASSTAGARSKCQGSTSLPWGDRGNFNGLATRSSKKEEELKTEEEIKKAPKDRPKPNRANLGKGLIRVEDLHIPDDLDLQAAMKEAKKDCKDFAQNIVHQTTIMMQEAQLTQIKLFQKMQLNYKNKIQEIDNRHRETLNEANEALAVMTK